MRGTGHDQMRVAASAGGLRWGRLVSWGVLVFAVLGAGGAVVACGQSQQQQMHPSQQMPQGQGASTGLQLTAQTTHYDLLLAVQPPQSMYTPDQVKAQHPNSGEVMLSGSMNMPSGMSGMSDMPGMGAQPYPSGWHHVELHVYQRASRAVVTDARPEVTILDHATGRSLELPIATMQGIKEGPPDFHYGNNVQLASGHAYTLTARVGGDVGTFQYRL